MTNNPQQTKSGLSQFLFVAACILVFIGLFRVVPDVIQSIGRPVNKKNLHEFPVVVLSYDKPGGKIDSADMVRYDYLSKYIQEHPNYSFTIPLERRIYIEKKLNESNVERNLDCSYSFKVSELPNGRQRLKAYDWGDKANHVGIYEASFHNIKPKRISTMNVFELVLFYIPLTMLVSVLIVTIVRFLLIRLVKRLRPTPAPL